MTAKDIIKHQFKKGKDSRRNMDGRPKIPCIKGLIMKALGGEELAEAEIQKMIQAMKDEAVNGDVRCFNALMDRVYGKPAQSVDVTSDGKSINPMQIVVAKDTADKLSDAIRDMNGE